MAHFSWWNIGTLLLSMQTAVENLVAFATNILNSLLGFPVNFNILLNILNPLSAPDAAEKDALSSPSGGVSVTFDSVANGSVDKPKLWESMAGHQAKTGQEIQGWDAIINIDEAFLKNSLFLDATPETSDDIPVDKIDGLSVFLHELLHAVGFNGYTDPNTMTNPGNQASAFDYSITVNGGVAYFTGETAKEVYGGAVPLTTGNIFHLGNATGAGSDLAGDLMNGVAYAAGTRYTVSKLDLAFLADVGIATTQRDIFIATSAADNYNMSLGDDEIRVLAADADASVVDTFNGAGGFDAVKYVGMRATFVTTLQANSNVEVVINGSKDVLISIERVSFDDGDLIFDIISPNAAAAYRLYGGAFDRTPDEGGFRFWTTDWLDKGKSLHDAAVNFLALPEFGALYGTNLTTKQFVDQLYLNVLDRPGETEGVNFWNNFLDTNKGDRADVLVLFTQLPEYVGNSLADTANGYWVIPAV